MRSEQFDIFLQDDMSWRKKEISELFFLAKLNNNEALLKSLILILYAHWEGYIKKSSKLYIKYVVEEKIKIQELTMNFKAIAMKEVAKACMENTESISLAKEFDFLKQTNSIDNRKFKVRIDIDNDEEDSIITTQHNLKPKVLKNIINILGCEYGAVLKARENYINSSLLANRNAIGHGSKFNHDLQLDFALNVNDIAKLKDFILTVLDFFTEILINYKEKKFYLICNEEDKVVYDDLMERKLKKKLEELEKKYGEE
ncbi:MAE_28990/MAE_18760 family HEPN-like nuclease [Bacillus mycoides]|uniref:MAE_28990/MAE_18760 family HEPN-like nuclease n=1 Tax=Bacillus mycoides TaxID=1405 RepID=UPI001C00D487|nr:MAE_28990/MAE_18760 family HEPN-like nuclease [Bacillus mycoides]QWH31225.1 hypothetical protein EXW51_25895 [Bacillus mycoides]